MKVIRAEILGFCMGVRRAVEMAWKASAAGNTGVYSLGPLIHNPGVLKSLEERGIKVLKEGEVSFRPQVSGRENPTVIIRAHGISPKYETELVKQGFHVLDATCPHVKQSQKKARSFAEKGYRIFLAGEENHGEIAGIRGYTEQPGRPSCCYVVGNPKEAEKAAEELFRREPDAKTALIAQTTINMNEYMAIAESLRRFFPAIEIVETICAATADRQKALRELCVQVDAVIVAGGRESANTRRLLSLAVELGKPAWLVEAAGEIPAEAGAYKTIGLSAGASTPDRLVDEIEEALRAL